VGHDVTYYGRYMSAFQRNVLPLSSVLRMKAVGLSRTLGWPDIPEDSNLYGWKQVAEENSWTGKRECDKKLYRTVSHGHILFTR
jgi:hypothetical protein